MIDIIYEEGFCACGCGNEIDNSKKQYKSIYTNGHNKATLGRKRPQYEKDYISLRTKEEMERLEVKEKISKENHYNWKGGFYHYHSLAWKKFGKDYCEECGMSLIDHYKQHNQRFDMHNTLEPKDYTIMKWYAWKSFCKPCHTRLENL